MKKYHFHLRHFAPIDGNFLHGTVYASNENEALQMAADIMKEKIEKVNLALSTLDNTIGYKFEADFGDDFDSIFIEEHEMAIKPVDSVKTIQFHKCEVNPIILDFIKGQEEFLDNTNFTGLNEVIYNANIFETFKRDFFCIWEDEITNPMIDGELVSITNALEQWEDLMMLCKDFGFIQLLGE